MMINCIVVDDEPAIIELVSSYIEQTPSLNLVNTTTRPVEAIGWVHTKQIDLVFLDVEMAECSGIEFMSRVRGKCHIILCTGYPQYAVDGFEHDVIDFLLKPVSLERFTRAVEKAEKICSTQNMNAKDHLLIKGTLRFQKIRVKFSDINYIQSLKNYVAIYSGKNKLVGRKKMGDIEKELPRSGFLRVHASYIIPLAKVKSFDNRVILLHDVDHEIPIGSTYKEVVTEILQAGNQP